MKIGSVLFALCFCFCLFDPTYQWGYDGHKIIAILANDMLTSQTQNIVATLINTSIPTIASLPDSYDHTSAGRWSSPLHYANLPHDVDGFVLNRDCPNPPACVVSAIWNFTALTTKRVNGMPWNHPGEPTPLEFLVHVIGDIHQPLHVGYGDDRGGNSVKVSFFGKSKNLHQVWDELIIQKYNSNPVSFASELQTYINNNQAWAASVANNQDVIGWANESYSLVKSDVYTFPDSVEDAGDASEPVIGNLYYKKELPNIKKRLMAGGLRLGQLINQLCGSKFEFLGNSQKNKGRISIN